MLYRIAFSVNETLWVKNQRINMSNSLITLFFAESARNSIFFWNPHHLSRMTLHALRFSQIYWHRISYGGQGSSFHGRYQSDLFGSYFDARGWTKPNRWYLVLVQSFSFCLQNFVNESTKNDFFHPFSIHYQLQLLRIWSLAPCTHLCSCPYHPAFLILLTDLTFTNSSASTYLAL